MVRGVGRAVTRFWTAVCVLSVAACQSVYQPPPTKLLGGDPLTVLYEPASRDVYVQFTDGVTRASEYDFEAVSSTAVTAGVDAVLIDPVGAVIGALIVGVPVIRREKRARHLAEPFSRLIGSWKDGQGRLVTAITNDLRGAMNLPKVSRRVLQSGEHVKPVRLGLADDHVLLVRSDVGFTPRFEVLEVRVRFWLFDRAAGTVDYAYRNTVVVQSKLHGGLTGDYVPGSIESAIDTELAAALAGIAGNHHLSSVDRRMARSRAVKRSRFELRSRLHRYSDFDDGDPEGALWLQNDAEPFRRALARGYQEAARLMVADLRGVAASKKTAKPPGYDEALARVPSLDRDDRRVYRLHAGTLLSLADGSRMIPGRDW